MLVRSAQNLTVGLSHSLGFVRSVVPADEGKVPSGGPNGGEIDDIIDVDWHVRCSAAVQSRAGQADPTRHGGELLSMGPDYHWAEGEDPRALKILRYAGDPDGSNLIDDSSSSGAKYRSNPLRIFSVRPSISLKPDILSTAGFALKQVSAVWASDIDPHASGTPFSLM